MLLQKRKRERSLEAKGLLKDLLMLNCFISFDSRKIRLHGKKLITLKLDSRIMQRSVGTILSNLKFNISDKEVIFYA